VARLLNRRLNDYSLLYLFSYDAELAEKSTTIDTSVGRLISVFVTSNLSTVYNVSGEATIGGLGQDAVRGQIEWGNDQLVIGLDDVARADIKATVVTDDQSRIDMRYTIVGYLGAGGSRRLLQATGDDEFGSEDFPFEAPFTSSPRFETATPKYRWLNDYQGVGFGKFQIVRNQFRRVTCDIYVLT